MLQRLSGPVRIGLLFASLGLALTAVGIARGAVSMQPASLALALLIGGGVWFLVAWAVATAARDVETDLATHDLHTDELHADTPPSEPLSGR